jgi:hypothetical protein
VTQKYTIGGDPVAIRARAYPPVADALDPIAAALEALASKAKVELPQETRAWIDARKRVKERIKKPDGK